MHKTYHANVLLMPHENMPVWICADTEAGNMVVDGSILLVNDVFTVKKSIVYRTRVHMSAVFTVH